VEDLIFVIRKDEKKYARANELIELNILLDKLRKNH